MAKSQLKDFPGAIADFTESIKRGPDHPDAYLSRGMAKSQLKDFPGAIADFTESIKRGPDHADAYFNRGMAKYKLKDFPGAIADYTATINFAPPHLEDAYEARGLAHTALRNEKEATDDFRRAVELRLKSSQPSVTHY